MSTQDKLNNGDSMKTLSYKSDPELKAMFVAEVKQHAKQDMLLQGTYGETDSTGFKGCAVGCAINSLNSKLGKKYETNDHTVYETELGIPEWLAILEDTIFEGLTKNDAKKWLLKFAQAIPVGVDLEPVKWKFSAYLMKENIARVKKLDISNDLKKQVLDALNQTKQVFDDAVVNGTVDDAARSAAESAARSARSAAYLKHSKKLITLLKESEKL